MANIAGYLGQQLLNWSLGGGAAVTAGTGRYVGVGLAAPNSTNGSEIATNSGMTRQTVAFSAAVSPTNTAGNSVVVAFGPISALGTIVGVTIWDTNPGPANSGNLLWYGTLTTSRTMNPGDQLQFAVGSILVSLN